MFLLNITYPYQTWDGHGVKMGTDMVFSGLLNFGGETNGKHSTWDTEEQTEIYNLKKDFMRIAACWYLTL